MKTLLNLPALGVLCLTLHAGEPAKVAIDTTQPGWRVLTAEDFAKVNSADDTWSWKDGMLSCTGEPLSVMRTVKEYLCLESEGSPIDFRNLHIRELP